MTGIHLVNDSFHGFKIPCWKREVVMGLCFCGLGSRARSINRSSIRKEADQDIHKENCGPKVVKFLKPRNIWAKEIKQEQAIYKNLAYNKVLTLEDLILSSPALNEGGIHGGDHLHALKQCSSRRVHPSFDAEIKQERVLHESKESLSMEVAMQTEEGGNWQSDNSTFHRSRSGKLKKKVSFRSPEVADIFILEYSQEIYVAE